MHYIGAMRVLLPLLLLAPQLEAAALNPQGSAPNPTQNPTAGARAVLESLKGEVRRVPLAELKLSDPRQAGAHFLRFEGLTAQKELDEEVSDLARLVLINGDEVRAAIRGGDGELLRLAVLRDTEVHFSIETLRSLVFPERLSAASIEVAPAEEGDRLYRLRGGGLDRVDGLVNGFSAEGVQFESNLGERTYAWREVAALFVEVFEEPSAATAESGSGTPVFLELHGGTRLRGQLRSLDARGVTLDMPGDPGLKLPLEALAEVAVDDAAYRFLSMMSPDDSGPSSPYGDDLGMLWSHRMDRDFQGAPLRSGGRIWPRGIWVHAPSRLTWKLDGAWRELRSLAGLDDAVAGSERASVIFRVFVDGEQRYASSVVRGGDGPVALPVISLVGAEELVLEVDQATDFHVRDRAIWIRPFLVR